MGNTRDIGNGQQLIDVGSIQQDVLGTYQKQLGLIDLQNKIAQAPFDTAKKQADAILAQHQVTQMAVADQIQQADLQSKIGTEHRAQLESFHKQLTSLPEVFAQDFETGKIYLQNWIPGSNAVKKEDGTIAAMIPTPEGVRTLVIPTRKVTDPEKALTIEEGLRKQLTSTPEYQGFSIVNEFHKNFQSTINQATGAGDTAALFSYIKLMDRNNQVREGQVDAARNIPGINQYFVNLYERALNTHAPVLGAANSPTRADLTRAAGVLYGNARESALQQAKFYGNLVNPSMGINPRAVVAPVGDITPDEVFGKQQDVGATQSGAPGGTQSSFSPKRPGASEAGVLPTGANPEAGKPPTAGELPIKPSQQLDQLTGQLLAPVFRNAPKPQKGGFGSGWTYLFTGKE